MTTKMVIITDNFRLITGVCEKNTQGSKEQFLNLKRLDTAIKYF